MQFFSFVFLYSLINLGFSTPISTILPGHSLKKHGRIVGGSSANPTQFPWQASVISCNSYECGYCGGSLISPKFILTAAHCVDGKTKFDIGLGSNDWIKPIIKTTSSIKIQHAKYNLKTLRNDIALVKLRKEIKLTRNIQVIKLSEAGIGNLEEQEVIVSGFGRTDDTTRTTQLNFVTLKVMSNSDCQWSFGPNTIFPSILCADGLDDESVCSGDSGGPLVLRQNDIYVQVGVVSFSPSTCGSGAPSGFTRVSSFLKWIKENMK